MTFVDITQAPEALLRDLNKNPCLAPYGGANFGMPLSLIEPAAERIVPIDRFFVRSNGPVPIIDPETWRLNVSGNVDRPRTFSLAELKQLGRVQSEAFLECAGNGRTRFDPVPPGTPWQNDAIGNALWEGLPLTAILALVGVRDDTVDLVAQGADFPEMRRGLPLAVARDPGVMLVWSMNGEPLPLAHGGPVRLLVPGWAGIASTKWLTGIEAVTTAFDGFWNTDNYVIWDEQGHALRPVAEMPPKSVIVVPEEGHSVAAGLVTIAGWAWSGHGAVREVDISTDGGVSWQPAALRPGSRRGWRRWEFAWNAEDPGSFAIVARATDERRISQPAIAPWNGKGYLMNAMHSVRVTVES